MKKHVIIRFLIFFILFAGAVEAKSLKDKSIDDKITIPGLYNPLKNLLEWNFASKTRFVRICADIVPSLFEREG